MKSFNTLKKSPVIQPQAKNRWKWSDVLLKTPGDLALMQVQYKTQVPHLICSKVSFEIQKWTSSPIKNILYRVTLIAWRGDNLNTNLFSLVEKLSLLLQDLFIKLRVKQEAAALSLRHRTAEVSQTLLEMIHRDPQLKEENTQYV